MLSRIWYSQVICQDEHIADMLVFGAGLNFVHFFHLKGHIFEKRYRSLYS